MKCLISTHKFLDDSLDKLREVEPLVGLTIPDIFTKHSNDFGVGVTVESIAALEKNKLELLIVGNDTIMDQAELGLHVADVRVTVTRTGDTVSSPTGMCHRGLAEENLGHINLLLRGHLTRQGTGDAFVDVLPQRSNFTNFLEENHRGTLAVAINSDT